MYSSTAVTPNASINSDISVRAASTDAKPNAKIASSAEAIFTSKSALASSYWACAVCVSLSL